MHEQHDKGVPFDAEDPNQQRLWQALGKLEQAAPSAQLHRSFYRRLDAATRPTLAQRLRGWLNNPWTPAMACLVVGLALGLTLRGDGGGAELDRLRQQVSDLNRHLVLDLLAEESPTDRLRGVMAAAQFEGDDGQLASALLTRAASDRNASVRSAAIDALGPRLRDPSVGEALMSLLPQVDSPLVQMALVDLILRYGSANQLEHLLALVRSGALHPDLSEHVKQSVRSVSA